MVTKRVTLQDEFDRFSERLFNERGRNIRDKSTFNREFDMFMEGQDLTSGRNKILRQEAFDFIVDKFPDKVDRRDLFKEAGGKDLARDQRRTAKTVVKTPEQFISRGAKRVDLERLDVKRKFNRIGLVQRKGQPKPTRVFATQVTITIRGKKFNYLRDQRGRFVKKL